jgi:hypothetical protein
MLVKALMPAILGTGKCRDARKSKCKCMDVSNSSMPTIAGTLAISRKASNSIGAWNSKNASKSMYANYNRDASNSRDSNIFGRGVLGHHVSKQQIPLVPKPSEKMQSTWSTGTCTLLDSKLAEPRSRSYEE